MLTNYALTVSADFSRLTSVSAPHCSVLTQTVNVLPKTHNYSTVYSTCCTYCTKHNAVGHAYRKQWIYCGLCVQHSKEGEKLWLHQSSTAWSGVSDLGYRPHQDDHVSCIACREGMRAWSWWSCTLHRQAERIFSLWFRSGGCGKYGKR